MTVLTKAPESQFAYVVLAARRARQIMAEDKDGNKRRK